MAFRDWLTSDGVFMPLYPWFSSAGDKFIEHGHRLLGMAAGMLTIALVAVCQLCEPRKWVRTYSLALLVGVIAQGALGGMRILLDERVLALLHGCTGPLFFAAAAGMVAVTSESWRQAPAPSPRSTKPTLWRLATLTALLAYLQLVVGAVVRHSPHMLGDRPETIFRIAVYFHVALAAVVTAYIIWLSARCVRQRVCVGVAWCLALLVLVQVLLGASSWIVKYGMPAWTISLIGETGHFNRASDTISAAIVAGHGAVGALIVALAVIIALGVGRSVGISAPATVTKPQLAGGLA